jgi:hypothetical protein
MPGRRRPGSGGLDVTILGTGRAGSAFAKALADRESASDVVARFEKAQRRGPEADLVLFCVRDARSRASRRARASPHDDRGLRSRSTERLPRRPTLRALAARAGRSVRSIRSCR